MSGRPIFRPSAVEAHRRAVDRAVVPRLLAWPGKLFCWLLLVALLAGALLAWSVHVPRYIAASGMIVAGGGPGGSPRQAGVADLFVAPDQSGTLRTQHTVQIRVQSTGTYVAGVVVNVSPSLIGPASARQRYGLAGLVTQPSAVVTVRLDRSLPAGAYGGSRVTARVQTGSRSIVSLLSG